MSVKEDAMKAHKEIGKARSLNGQLGTRCAAGYLRNRGWSIEAALWILFGK